MSGPSFFFFYQKEGKESKWDLALATEREKVIATKPVFTTVLDLSAVPDDGDWSKTRYRGPFYVDFDDEDNVENAGEQLKVFLGKLTEELDFDISQALFFATGSKGFHVEIPPECFMPKVPPTGTAWLPYVYRAMAESMMVDSLDLKVYTGKKGRQWRVPNVQRENGCYKVALSLDEVLSMSGEVYHELIKEPRPALQPTPPSYNAKFGMLFERSKDKVTAQMRGKKKRVERANEILDPFKKAKKTPATIEKIMNGEDLRAGCGFQNIAMQLAIYATAVGMPLTEFLDRCKGVCENHVSDSRRYNTLEKRRAELTRMYEYMESDTLYDFDVGPISRLLVEGTPMTDLGVMATEDDAEPKKPKIVTGPDGEETEIVEDIHKEGRKGFFMNADGMWRRANDQTSSICRATLREVESYYGLEKQEFKGYEFDIHADGKKLGRSLLAMDAFISGQKLKQFFASYQLSFQGSDIEAGALLDIMREKAQQKAKVYACPREGFFIINSPESLEPVPVKCYVTKDSFRSSLKKDDPGYFELRYRSDVATSGYNIDIHHAPDLDESHIPALHDLLLLNKPEIMANLLGWFTAAHYRSAYIRLYEQFPMLQVIGTSGSGKSKQVTILSHLHWYRRDKMAMKTARGSTPFALRCHAMSSSSAPMIIDEYKPAELRKARGDRYEDIKNLFKQNYIQGEISDQGSLVKGAESHITLVSGKSTAPICVMGEAIEMETAIMERSVIANVNPAFFTTETTDRFNRLFADSVAVSALGKLLMQMGFQLNLQKMRESFDAIHQKVKEGLPGYGDPKAKQLAPRIIFNRALIVHSLTTLKQILATKFGAEFDAEMDMLITSRMATTKQDAKIGAVMAMSEISKVMNRVALLSRERDMPYEVRHGIDYDLGEGYIEILIERAYDCYRRYCTSIGDKPLFASLDSFTFAMETYVPAIDTVCLVSPLRQEASDKVMRFSLEGLQREGVHNFRSA